jgi:hypothetical protein
MGKEVQKNETEENSDDSDSLNKAFGASSNHAPGTEPCEAQVEVGVSRSHDRESDAQTYNEGGSRGQPVPRQGKRRSNVQ